VPDDEEPEYLSLAEAALRLRFSVKTLERWAEEGRLPFVIMSGEKRFALDDLDAIRKRITGCD
jgi:excisionase family DNA binding protein